MTECRYFAEPHRSTASTWSEERRQCGICGERRLGYEGPNYGVDELDFACEECLVSGALAERGLSTTTGDIGPNERRFCRIEREVGQRELDELGEGDGGAFFRKHRHPELHEYDIGWDVVPPRGPTSRDESNSPSVYLVRCLACSEVVLWYDMD